MGLSSSISVRTRVLVVDESNDQRQLLRIHFENAGCDVTLVESAEAALIALDDAHFDLAVIELLLPGIDGWTLAERIDRDHPDCRTAICSVLDEESYPAASIALAKPVTRSQIRSVLAELPDQRMTRAFVHSSEAHSRDISV